VTLRHKKTNANTIIATMNLASPAPRVEGAKADKAPSPDAAVTEPARPSESVKVDKAEHVEPAVAGIKEPVIAQAQQ